MKLSTAVLDVGKTHTKLSIWDAGGTRLEQAVRANVRHEDAMGGTLDTDGIEAWLIDTLADAASRHRIGRIIPVAHGAAAALIAGGCRVAPARDYEVALPPALSDTYDTLRDPFVTTGSPALPGGLNLGRQLFGLAARRPDLLAMPGLQILTWPEYWAWFLSGIAASERSSLGCHTDLWSPVADDFSPLAGRLKLADKFAPLRRSGECLGTITSELARRTGLDPDVTVHCGIHDSNAGLLAGQAQASRTGKPVTVLSTGTWFVAMHSGGSIAGLSEARDCLVNVAPNGRPVPSARFMGGREAELLLGDAVAELAGAPGDSALLCSLLADDPAILPALVDGSGPFAGHRGGWTREPGGNRLAAVQLYLASVADEMLYLVGATDTVVVEGRFARAGLFVSALAALNPGLDIVPCTQACDAAFGALRCLDPDLGVPETAPQPVAVPAQADPARYRAAWRRQLGQARISA